MTQTQAISQPVVANPVGRLVGLLYGIASYLLFLVTFVYAIGFVSGRVVPKTIDTGTADPTLGAFVIDILLMSLFAIQHSVMARKQFKQWWTQYVPKSVERTTYVLFSSLVLILLFWHQVANNLVGRPMPAPSFRTPVFYGLVRHPIYLGFIIAFWATPRMTAGHLLFAAVTTSYIVVAIQLEERDLIAVFGEEYRRYRERVSMLVPWRKS